MEKIDGNKLRGHLDAMVLSVLDQRDAHGFEIMQQIEKQGSGALHMKEGTLYPALYRLEEAGLVKAQWEDDTSSRRGPRRRIYHITVKGKKELNRQRVTWRQFVDVVGNIVEAPK
ncbi:MAG: helix-turn-helix transcriptional regulator [Candidatus Hydrogenedentes bacterium]|nr:helix-turn-helix transcriptional regulator [Candidatus Hydrogenedentota bacterium]